MERGREREGERRERETMLHVMAYWFWALDICRHPQLLTLLMALEKGKTICRIISAVWGEDHKHFTM